MRRSICLRSYRPASAFLRVVRIPVGIAPKPAVRRPGPAASWSTRETFVSTGVWASLAPSALVTPRIAALSVPDGGHRTERHRQGPEQQGQRVVLVLHAGGDTADRERQGGAAAVRAGTRHRDLVGPVRQCVAGRVSAVPCPGVRAAR